MVANQYKNNHKIFLQTAQHWANIYAGSPSSVPEYDNKVKMLCDMGFDQVFINFTFKYYAINNILIISYIVLFISIKQE